MRIKYAITVALIALSAAIAPVEAGQQELQQSAVINLTDGGGTRPSYGTITCLDPGTLSLLVNETIQLGWKPMGGMVMGWDGSALIYGQAMVKDPN